MLRFSYRLSENAQRHCISNALSLASHLLSIHSLSPHDFDYFDQSKYAQTLPILRA